MLRLRPFTLLAPATVHEAIGMLAEHDGVARAIAGGTDLLPSMKLRQSDPEVLVSLSAIAELQGFEFLPATAGAPEALWIGAGTRLFELAESPAIAARIPALAYAASRIAAPQIRNMGTVGGNLCLDTRCRWVNQSPLFRAALGGCLKSHGSQCHVVLGGKGCVAALSSDLAIALIAPGATLLIAGPGGHRERALGDFYGSDGLHHTELGPAELLLGVRVPLPGPRTLLTYRKWAVRRAIDFPLVSVGLRLDLAPDEEVIRDGMLAVGVLGPRPRRLPLGRYAGARLDEALAERLGDVAFKRCRPLPNVPYDADYRRSRIRVEVRRAVRALAARPASGEERR